MTTWAEVKKYVHQKYKVEDVNDDLMKLLFETSAGRSQLVFIEHAYNDSAEWIKMNSPLGKLDEVNIATACRLISDKLMGGIVLHDDMVAVTNAMPIADLDANEIDEPMARLSMIADELERYLTGKDTW